jgi:hypothetical protein
MGIISHGDSRGLRQVKSSNAVNYSAFSIGKSGPIAEKRRARRRDVCCKGLIHDLQGSVIASCLMTNASASGAKLLIETEVNVPDLFVLGLARNASVRRQCEVVWRAAKSIGVRFTVPPPSALEQA